MAFQKLFTPFLAVSVLLTISIYRHVAAILPLWSLGPLIILCVFLLYATVLVYTITIRPLTSSLRHLPKAPQPPVWQRLLKEPSAYHFEKWFREVPNNGLIRYYGVLNIERILVTSPAYTRQILQANSYLYEKQYGQRTHLERVGGRGLVWQEGNMHKVLRRALEPAFKSSLVRNSYFNPVVRKTEMMLSLVKRTLNESQKEVAPQKDDEKQLSAVLELDEIIHKTVFDIMGLVAFGPEMDFQSIFKPELYYEPLKDYRLAFKPSPSNRIRVYAAFFLPTWAVNMLPIRFNLTTALAIRRFRQIGKDWIDQQTRAISEQEAQLSSDTSFIMESVLRKGELSKAELLEQFSMLQAGGIHSTGAAMMSTLWWLAHPANHSIQNALRDEIRAKVASPDPRLWSPKILESCEYLNAVISEVLRLHPPFSWLGRTPIRQMDLDGTQLPAGVSLSLSPWAAHRDPAIWGSDAAEFRPERWLELDNRLGNTALPSTSSLLSFGAGPRKCIAESLARMELQCVIAALFGQYKFEAVVGCDMPTVTHQSTLAFRSELKLRTTLMTDWGF